MKVKSLSGIHAALFLGVGLILTGCLYIHQVLVIGAGYKAKILCSNVFYAQRKPEQVLSKDLYGLEGYIPATINYAESSVEAGWKGLIEQKAIYLGHVGCTLLAGKNEQEFRRAARDWWPDELTHELEQTSEALFSKPVKPRLDVDQNKLLLAIKHGFAETNLDVMRQTRAILVLHKGRLLAEKYAPGFDRHMPLLGWSMSKSVINALVGILVKQGKLDIHQVAPVRQWLPASLRSAITIDQLLRMSSGLQFDETRATLLSDVTTMLFKQADSGAYAAAKPLHYVPDRHWQYASGTSNIISGIIRQQCGGATADIIHFMHSQLFQPLGIKKAIIEVDSSGNLVGSSFMYATAREWLAFGQLYVQQGVWKGQRILSKDWVSYSSSPTPTAPKGEYAAHFWANGGIHAATQHRPFPSLPGDLYYAAGFKGQRLMIIPSHELVVLRMGWGDGFGDADMVELLEQVISALMKNRA